MEKAKNEIDFNVDKHNRRSPLPFCVNVIKFVTLPFEEG